MTTPHITPEAVAELRRRVSGRIAYPGDTVYAELLHGHDTAVHHRPLVAVEPVTVADVAAVVEVAGRHALPVVPLATGHGLTEAVTDGVVLATSALRDLDVDPAARTVWVGAGVRWAEVAPAAARHDLMPVSTNGPGVGVVGSVLGGGIGPLSRSHGFAADHVRRLTVVTPDAAVHTVDAGSDLAWALLGSRDGLGVVVAVELELTDVAELWATEALWTGVDPAATLGSWQRRAALLPDHVAATATVALLPEVGPAVHVRETSSSGSPGRPLDDLDPQAPVQHRPWTALPLGRWLEELGDAADPMPTWQRGIALTDATDETIEVLVAHLSADPPPPLLGIELRRLGGATRIPRDNSVGGRDAEWLVNVLAAPVPELFETVVPAAVDALEATLEPWATGGTLLNFHGRPSDARPLDLAVPAGACARLARIRSRHDGRNPFAPAARTLSS